AVRMAIEVANGLAFTHTEGIIHADLKPANILFDANDAAKICDFGIARNPQEDADTPQLYATAMYVAPERVEGKSATVQSDVYGLGLVLYEGLVGKPPFTSTNAAVLLRDHVVRQPVPPSHLRPSLPRELDSIVLKALAKQPNLRYQKASDFATALQRIENVDKELATTRIVMADPLEDFVPKTEQSPVVALLSTYGQPLRGAFFSLCAALPVFAMALLTGFELIGALLAAGLVAVVAFAGQLGVALAMAWVRVRAAEVKSALLTLLQNPSDRFGPLGTQLDPSVLWSQMAGLVSRLATATLETWIATVLAWTIAGLTVWTVTRILRTFFDTLLRR